MTGMPQLFLDHPIPGIRAGALATRYYPDNIGAPNLTLYD
jgi:hypothetical protein